MLRKFIVLAIAMSGYYHISAQDSTIVEEKPKPIITGSLDAYYRYNFANPKNDHLNNFTSFTNSHNSFELGMASIKLEHTIGKVGAVIDLGYGRRAAEFSYPYQTENTSMMAIKQAYLTYSPSSAVKFTFGSWATHVGYELVDAYLNRNYSMSYMFSYGPFFHTGLKADISLGGKSAFMVGVTNPTDLRSATNMPKMFVGQFSTGSRDDKLKAWVNFQGGKFAEDGRLTQGDLVLTYALGDKFSLGYNGTVQSRSGKDSTGKWSDASAWWGSALYLNIDPVSWFGMTVRGEYFDDKKDILGFNTAIFVPTLTFNFKVDNLTIMPEFRFEGARDPLYIKNSGDNTKSTGSFILGAAYHF
ncbi:outer membrane beta-barrel protein [Flavitalea antarctica]